ncbi:RIMS-binding protein 2 [Acipenser ruthenus]|uniref:RIMS-binding protein 2 n=1 Tax=Acipenser ruthenus TaxID=7906 RepID=A0A444UVC1_ACIRT|nr:RIMS-binding protein 2 [Acipenser ruthenus]
MKQVYGTTEDGSRGSESPSANRSLISEFIRPIQISGDKPELLSVKPTFLTRSHPSSPRRGFLAEAKVRELEQKCRTQSEQFNLLSKELEKFRLQAGHFDLLSANSLAVCDTPGSPSKSLSQLLHALAIPIGKGTCLGGALQAVPLKPSVRMSVCYVVLFQYFCGCTCNLLNSSVSSNKNEQDIKLYALEKEVNRKRKECENLKEEVKKRQRTCQTLENELKDVLQEKNCLNLELVSLTQKTLQYDQNQNGNHVNLELYMTARCVKKTGFCVHVKCHYC